MLILTRKAQESIVIDGDIKVTICSIKSNQISVGIEAPDEADIVREELIERKLFVTEPIEDN